MNKKRKTLIILLVIALSITAIIITVILVKQHKQKQLEIERETLLQIGTHENPLTKISDIDFYDYVNKTAHITIKLTYNEYNSVSYRIPEYMTDLTIESVNDRNVPISFAFSERKTDFNLTLKNIHSDHIDQFITVSQYAYKPEFTLNINYAGENILYTPYTEGYGSFRCYLIKLENIDVNLNAIENNSTLQIKSSNGKNGNAGTNGKTNQMSRDDANAIAGENGSSGLSLLYCKSLTINTNNFNTTVKFTAGNGGNGGNGGKGGTYYVVYPLIKDKGLDGTPGRGGKGGICIFTKTKKITLDNKTINLIDGNENSYSSDTLTIQDGTNGKTGDINS